MFQTDLFSGKVCLVTGGGTGMGFALTQKLLALGASVVVSGRRVEVLENAETKLKSEFPNAKILALNCDNRLPGQVEATVKQAIERLGKIDILVNNAGGQFMAPAEMISPNGFEAVVKNNLLGTWNVTREVALKSMIPNANGLVLNVIANIQRGFPGMVHTGAARAGVENMTKTLAVEWVRHNIRVNAIAPGVIASDAIVKYPREALELMRKSIPMKRFGSVKEVVNTMLFMLSPGASYMTGETLYLDGGARLWGESWPIPD